MKYRAKLHRHTYKRKQVLGNFELFNQHGKVFECKTLELAWKGNEQRISCIPTGTYTAKLRDFGDWANESFHITETNGKEVNGRSAILIHKGNFFIDILGCILLGKEFADIELKSGRRHVKKDGYLDVTSSGRTMTKLLSITTSFELEITGEQPEFDSLPATTYETDTQLAPFKSGDKAEVKAHVLNMRKEPTTNAERITQLHKGLPLEIVEIEGGWAKVTVEGYVFAEHLRKEV